MDPIAHFFSHPTPRRLLRVGLFLGLLWEFSELLPMLAAFALTERLLSWAGGHVGRRTGWSEGRSALLVAAWLFVGTLAALILGGQAIGGALAKVEADVPGLLATLRQNPVLHRMLEWAGEQEWTDTGIEAAQTAVEWLRDLGYLGINVAVGFGLALIYMFEREELAALVSSMDRTSVPATLLRWIDHVGDGLAITFQLQLVVAACNSLLTLPLLLGLGLPYVPALVTMIFLAALVPVVGNLCSGAVLIAVAWPQWGWIGVIIFAFTTFALGKIEGFYLNPRLAARHVRLPGFVLTVSLVMWEQMYGFVGFFLSFPFLYVLERIRGEMRDGWV